MSSWYLLTTVFRISIGSLNVRYRVWSRLAVTCKGDIFFSSITIDQQQKDQKHSFYYLLYLCITKTGVFSLVCCQRLSYCVGILATVPNEEIIDGLFFVWLSGARRKPIYCRPWRRSSPISAAASATYSASCSRQGCGSGSGSRVLKLH